MRCPGEKPHPSRPQRRPSRVDVDLSQVQALVEEIDPHGNLIALLQRAQAVFGYLPEPVIDEIARLSGVPSSRIFGIVTFYAQFTDRSHGTSQGLRVPRHRLPRGRRDAHHRGAGAGARGRRRRARADQEFTLDSVACMGACSRRRSCASTTRRYGNSPRDETRKVARELLEQVLAERGARRMPETVPAEGVKVSVSAGAIGRQRVSVCAGTACVFADSMKVRDAFVAGSPGRAAGAGRGQHHRLPRPLLAGFAALVSDGDTYYPRLKLQGTSRPSSRSTSPAGMSSRSCCTSTPPRRAHHLRPRHPVLQGAGPHRAR